MKPELLIKFKALFEEQRNALVFSKINNEEFHIKKEDMMDETDWTAVELESNMRLRLRNREALFLKKIDEALARIAEGSFGECESCEEEIDAKRLEATDRFYEALLRRYTVKIEPPEEKKVAQVRCPLFEVILERLPLAS